MLGELIEQRRAELGRSYADLSKRAETGGYRLSLQSIHQLARNPITNMPRTETIRGLAYALEVPDGVVAISCVESVGVKVPSNVGNDANTVGWLTLTEGRDDRQIRHLLRVARDVAEGWDLDLPRRPTEGDQAPGDSEPGTD